MKISEFFLSGNFQFLEAKFSLYLNMRVFVMTEPDKSHQTNNKTIIKTTHDNRPSKSTESDKEQHYN